MMGQSHGLLPALILCSPLKSPPCQKKCTPVASFQTNFALPILNKLFKKRNIIACLSKNGRYPILWPFDAICIHGHRKQSLYFFLKGFTSPNKPTPPDFHVSHLPSISNPATQAWLSWASSRPTCLLNSCNSCHRCRCCWWIPTTSVRAAARRTSRRAAATRRCSWQRRSCSTCGRAPRICCRDPLRRRNGWRGACLERGERVRKSGKVTLRWIFASFTDFQHFIYVFFPLRISIHQTLNRCTSKCHVPMFNSHSWWKKIQTNHLYTSAIK